MKLIVGLGNPGEIYRDSRHNIGFSAVKVLAEASKNGFKKDTGTFSLVCRFKSGDQNIVLALPLTFMNLSGIAVKTLLKKYKIQLNNLLVVCDDLDLELGRIKIKPCGSSGGHRGLKSISDSVESEDFARIRIGIGRPPNTNIAVTEYVLASFTKTEQAQMKIITEKAADCCRAWITEGIDKTMTEFNSSRIIKTISNNKTAQTDKTQDNTRKTSKNELTHLDHLDKDTTYVTKRRKPLSLKE